MTVPIVQVLSYELADFEGLKKIEIRDPVAYTEIEVPEESVAEMKEVIAVCDKRRFRGIGHVMVSMGQQVFPREIQFDIDGVEDIGQAVNKYKEAAMKMLEAMKEEQERRKNSIQPATPADINAIKSASRIITP